MIQGFEKTSDQAQSPWSSGPYPDGTVPPADRLSRLRAEVPNAVETAHPIRIARIGVFMGGGQWLSAMLPVC